MMKKFLLSVSLLMLLSGQVWATDYYFANGGNDDDDTCTEGAPCATITKCNAIMAGLDNGAHNFYFNRGDTWTLNSGAETDHVLAVTVSGSDDSNRVVIGAYGTGALPIFDGVNQADTSPDYKGIIAIDDEDYVTIEYLEIKNAIKNLIGINQAGNTAYTPSYITIQHCTIHSNRMDGYMGIYVMNRGSQGNTDHIVIDSNTIYDITHNGVRTEGGVTNETISNNTFTAIEHHCVDSWYYTGKAKNDTLTVYGNSCSASTAGFFIAGTENSEYYNNTIYDLTNLEGDYVFAFEVGRGDGAGGECSNVIIYANRIWDLDVEHANTTVFKYYQTTNLKVYNNTIYSNYRTFIDGGNNTNPDAQNNLCYANTNTAAPYTNYGSDPKFTDPGNDDFTLQSSSPARQAGSDLGANKLYCVHPVTGVMVDPDLYDGGLWPDGAYVWPAVTAALTIQGGSLKIVPGSMVLQ